MSVSNVHSGTPAGSSHHAPTTGLRDIPRPWTVGQQVTVIVQRHLGGQYYLAQIANRAGQVVASSVNLAPGTPLRATVVAVGARLELKLLNPDGSPTVVVSDPDPDTDDSLDSEQNEAPIAETSGAAAMASQIDSLGARYQVTLSERDHNVLATAMTTVGQPRAMALGGLYLAKVGLPLTPTTLGALYDETQNGSPAKHSIEAALNLGALMPSHSLQAPSQLGALAMPQSPSQLDALVERMDATLNRASPSTPAAPVAPLNTPPPQASTDGGATAGGQRNDAGGASDLAHQLLNVPLGATVARHYGTFPVLVSGQLIELQFVAFQHREVAPDQNPVRRLFMTLTTPVLGRLQIAAQAQGNRLSVTFTGQSAEATETLASHAPEVRALVSRLGWQIDSVVYGVGQPAGAAEIAMTHALLESTMDQLL
jgi:hypothetical protein